MNFANKYKWWLYATGFFLAAYSLFMASDLFHDDAYITLRYAERFLDGKGFTWNNGYRVEGFTNPLWLFQIIAMGKLGINLTTGAQLLSVVYFLGILIIFLWLECYPPLFLLLATLPPFTYWVLSGMESTSFIFWLLLGLASTYRYVKPSKKTVQSSDKTILQVIIGFSFAAAALTRPEGLGVGLIALLWIFRKKGLVGIKRAGFIFLVPVFGYFIFRYAYFRDILPNTYYAKSYGIPLSYKLTSFIKYSLKWSVLWLPFFGTVTILAYNNFKKISWWMLVTGTPVIAAILAAGGGYMKGARLFVPFLMIYALSTIVSTRGILQYESKVITILILMTLGWQVLGASVHWSASLPITFGKKPGSFAAERGELLSKFLNIYLPPNALVAVNSTGSTSYFAPSISFLDMLGLSDIEIAKTPVSEFKTTYQRKPGHNKGNGPYVISREPDIIILGLSWGTPGDNINKLFLSGYELVNSPLFREKYSLYKIIVSTENINDSKYHYFNDINATGKIVSNSNFVLHAYLKRGSLNTLKLLNYAKIQQM